MNNLNLEDPQVRADVETVGRDFDDYGGDIPFAIVTSATKYSDDSDAVQAEVAEVMARALAARDVASRMKPLADACSRLRAATQNDQWLVPVLLAYRDRAHSPDDVRVLLQRAVDQLQSLKPNWPAFGRVMWGVHRDSQLAAGRTYH